MKVEEVNPANHTARVTARGADAKDSGGANATASFRLGPEGSGSKVLMQMEVALSGGVAQYGRGRMLRPRAGVRKGYGIQIGNGRVRSARPTKQPW